MPRARPRPVETASDSDVLTDSATTDAAEPETGAATVFDRPSKTRLKQASHDLQDLGAAAVALPDARLAGLPLSEPLQDAIRQYKKTKTHEGRRRQMQYIGKLMRRTDVAPIQQAVTDMQLGRAKDALALHQAEHWRVELLADDDALTRWTAAHPATDVQQLRSLVRAARKDASQEPEKRSGRAFRDLFCFVKQATLGNSDANQEADDE